MCVETNFADVEEFCGLTWGSGQVFWKKKDNLQQCQNYRKINLISHPSKVTPRITMNRLKPQAKTIAEEQAGFRAGRSTTEQIFNLQILIGKYFQR